MEDNQIIEMLNQKLKDYDMWYATKNDPTWDSASHYYKLDEYGDLTDASVKQVAKEINSFVGDGAIDIEDAIEVFIIDALQDNRIAYTSCLVTKFKDKPVVDNIEAYENPVQLSESKKLNEDNIGYDHYGPKIMNSFEGPAFIRYDGGPGAIENLVKARNGRFIWKNSANSDSEPYKFDSFDEALAVQEVVGGEIISWNEYFGVDESKKQAKVEGYKRRIQEENNKSSNLISQMFQADDFDAESNQGQIVIRTSELFNALSEKGYDVQVTFDNGESQSVILLGNQGGQVIITITDADQPLNAFANGNFEINGDTVNILSDIQEQISTL